MTVLVTYASKHGSTRGIAEAIGRRLGERGLDAEVRPVGEVGGLERYEAVVVGSAVYIGSWMKEAQRFLDHHAEDLRRVPVWLFSSGPTGPDANAEALLDKQKRRLDTVGARDLRVFSGALDPKDLGFFERGIVKKAKTPIGDFRDWSDIEAWADSIADGLGPRA